MQCAVVNIELIPQPPINNDRACACLIGLKPKTTKAHIVRAVLESLAFRCKLIYDEMLKETRDLPTNFFRYRFYHVFCIISFVCINNLHVVLLSEYFVIYVPLNHTSNKLLMSNFVS